MLMLAMIDLLLKLNMHIAQVIPFSVAIKRMSEILLYKVFFSIIIHNCFRSSSIMVNW